MVKSLAIGLLLLLGAGATPAGNGGELPDDAIRSLIVGGWIVSDDSEDYIPDFSETLWLEIRADGTEILHVYDDETCMMEIETITARWIVAGGTLITDYGDGHVDRDEVLSIDKRSMTLVFEDGMTGVYTRAAGCGRQNSL